MAKKYKRKKKSGSNKSWILIPLIFLGAIFLYTKISANDTPPTEISINETQNKWTQANYPFRKEIEYIRGKVNVVVINHLQLVLDGKSQSNAQDLIVVDSEGNNLPFTIKDPNSLNTKIFFDPLQNTTAIYVYYGNKIPDSSLAKNDLSKSPTPSNATLKDEDQPIVAAFNSKKWVLKENNKEDFLEIQLNSNSSLKDETSKFDFYLDNKYFNSPSIKENILKVNSEQLSTGEHQGYIIAKTKNGIFKTNNFLFNVSYPLYVAWTIDWEGSDPGQKNLTMMEKVANDFSLKMTHFFNPRIYIASKITDQRRRDLTKWVLDRQRNYEDDIAMHQHMHQDMLADAGVKPNETLKSWDNGFNGYDTPSTYYSKEEYLKILTWGLNQFKKWGLPTPEGFRAGGWFANTQTLQAMQEAGFKYDSSGRDPMAIGANKLVQDWRLTSSTQPYFPSQNDINDTAQPTMNILEIPDNGADSYWSDSKKLIDNFYANYSPNEILDKSKLVVFLSHPDWFAIDDPKLRELLPEIIKFRFEKDLGPVKFVTMKEYLDSTNVLKQ